MRPVFAQGAAPTTDLFSSQLQTALNSGRSEDFDALLAADLQPELAARYQRFSQDFPDVSWRVESGQPLADGRPTLLVRISGEARSDGLTYRLDAEERIAIRQVRASQRWNVLRSRNRMKKIGPESFREGT